MDISIHAPTRGATIARDMVDFFFIRFQSTLPRGERRYGLDGYTVANVFQSTLPRGERPLQRYERRAIRYFNPRSHEGSDHISPYKGCCRIYFNPRSHEGSDLVSSSNTLFMTISIHAPTRGATKLFCESFTALPEFQSTLPRGERRASTPYLTHSIPISIHAPTRGATLLTS